MYQRGTITRAAFSRRFEKRDRARLAQEGIVRGGKQLKSTRRPHLLPPIARLYEHVPTYLPQTTHDELPKTRLVPGQTQAPHLCARLAGWLGWTLLPLCPGQGGQAVPPWRGSDICCYGASHPHKQGAMSLTEEPRGGMGGLFFSFLLLHAMPCIVEGRQVT